MNCPLNFHHYCLKYFQIVIPPRSLASVLESLGTPFVLICIDLIVVYDVNRVKIQQGNILYFQGYNIIDASDRKEILSSNILASSHVGGRLVCLIQINDLAWKTHLLPRTATHAYHSSIAHQFYNSTQFSLEPWQIMIFFSHWKVQLDLCTTQKMLALHIWWWWLCIILYLFW